MKVLSFLFLYTICLLLCESAVAQAILPVRNLRVEDFSLNAAWDAPRKTILTQDFESSAFAPTGWQERTNHAVGWYLSEGGSSPYFVIPEHTQYALVNDDAGGTGIDGCCEYLITPALDLSVCNGFKLTFDSYFNGNNGQKATVEMSTDNGLTWSLVEQMIHYPTWKQVEIDLSSWSGTGGLSSVMFAFHADDQGNQASGWAVDNIVIQSDSLGVTGYTLFLNQNPIAVITETEYFISPNLVTYGLNYNFCVRASYPSGFADTCLQFTSYYLHPPANLTATSSDNGIWFNWQTPVSASEIISYNIYSNDSLVFNVPVSVTSWFYELEFGEACLDVTAIHDISIYGFPGIFAESAKVTACGFVETGFDVPFTENWTSGNFTLNKWTAGSNWSVTGQVGNEAPSVKYEGGKSAGSYSSALTSWHFNSLGYDDCPSGYGSMLEFEIKLNDVTASGTEELIVELVTNQGITELKRYKNEGSFYWINESFDITLKVLDYNFQVRFRTEGQNLQNIGAWYIDNIRLYNYFSDYPQFLEVHASRQGSPENDIKVTYDRIDHSNVALNYIIDDGTAEYWYSGNVPGELWKGNKFPVNETGILQKASVLCQDIPGSNSSCTIDIFTENGDLIGSSAPFTPLNNIFTDVYLPDIPFSGAFYAMFHVNAIESSNSLGVDTNGPNSSADFAWVYNGSSWFRLVDYTSVGGVFMIRVSALVGDSASVYSGNPCNVLGYNIYRREYSSFPTGPNNSGTGDFKWIGSTPFGVNQFIDRDLNNIQENCYEYEVKEQFTEGESMSNYAWDCIYVNVKEPDKASVTIFPNPSSTSVNIGLSIACESMVVYSVSGTVVYQQTMNGMQVLVLDVSRYAPGIYNLKFISVSGECFTRKLIKM